MSALHVRLYGKPGCCLCDQAAELLDTLHGEYEFVVEKVNIENDPALKEKLTTQIPVITIDGGNRVALNITEERLRRAFKRALNPQADAKD